MSKKILLAAALCFLPLIGLQGVSAHSANIVQFGECSPAKHLAVTQLLQKIQSKPYISIRAAIISAGWKPAPLPETAGWRTDDTGKVVIPYNAQEQPFADRNFSELQGCAEDQNAPCTFLFIDNKNDRLRIFTSGEENEQSHAVVNLPADLACPPAKMPS